jgi:hypothetical protein
MTLLGLLLLTGCSQGAPKAAPGGASGSGGVPSHTAAGSAPADRACTGGLNGTEPGVVRITCDGTATIRVQAGDTGKDFHGGVCHSAGDVWSAAAGVVIDATGVHGTYTGPPVDSVAVNNTTTGGKGTIQLVLGGRHYFDLGNATIALAAGGKGARLEGRSEKLSDAPGAEITVEVTC